MRDRWGETSSFKEGLSIVRRLVAEGARRPGTQQCTLLLLSHPDRPLFFKHRDVNNRLSAESSWKTCSSASNAAIRRWTW